MMTDPIADMLTRIRNANNIHQKNVLVPHSKEKEAILNVLVSEGYIVGFSKEQDGIQSLLNVELKYVNKTEKVIRGLKRISKPGLRVYASKNDLPKVLNGLGISIISTSKGILSDRQARKQGVGGEVIAFVW